MEHQAVRLGIPIEEFGKLALQAQQSVRIAGRCTVFAESDMIHKQQLGFGKPEIIRGLCEALVRNFINNLATGKPYWTLSFFKVVLPPIKGSFKLSTIFTKESIKLLFPKNMGSWAHGVQPFSVRYKTRKTSFQGFEVINRSYENRSFTCDDCPNSCEIVVLKEESKVKALWGSRCGKWIPELVDEKFSEKEEKTLSFSKK